MRQEGAGEEAHMHLLVKATLQLILLHLQLGIQLGLSTVLLLL